MTYNNLKAEAYRIAQEHGFYKDKLTSMHYLAFVTAELGEALNAHRQNLLPDVARFQRLTQKPKTLSDHLFRMLRPNCNRRFYDAFRRCIKDSVADEIADAIILLLSLSGACNIDIDAVEKNENYHRKFARWSFAENKLAVEKNMLNNFYKLPSRVRFALDFLFDWGNSLGYEMNWFVEQKMKYNELRPFLNGKKY